LKNQDGTVLVATLLALALLAILALVAARLAVNERQSSWNEWVHAGSFQAADSGGEAAIGWLLETRGAPPIPNYGASMRVGSRGMTSLDGSQNYSYSVDFVRVTHRAGNGVMFPEFYYNVSSSGEAGSNGKSNVNLLVSKQILLGY